MSDQAIKTLLARLEAVTARLESVEQQLATGGGAKPAAANTTTTSAALGEVNSASLNEFDDLVRQHIDKYVELSDKIAPIVKQQADLVKEAVKHHRNVLAAAAQSKKPSDDVFQKLVKPTNDVVLKIIEIRDKNRASPHFNHLSTLSEGIPCLGWVGVSPTPGPFVDESRASSEFYSNKILMQYRHDQSDAGKTNVAWVQGWNTFLKELRQWIKVHHTTALTWSGSGDASAFVGGAAPAPSTGGGAPPPPGPPPPPVIDFGTTTTTTKSQGDHAALFAEINAVRDRQKSGKTEGLRHVTKDMKTKYQDKSALGAAPTPKAPAGRTTTTTKTTSAPSRPPKLELEGNKWVVEFQKGNKELVIDGTEPKHTVYIYKCEDAVVQIKTKVNAITIDSCKKVGVVFESCISSVEVVNCNSVQVQVNGKVPSILVDKTSGAQLFVSKDCLDVEIVTSKSDEMNVVLPPKTAADDIEEIAIPEQFKTVIQGRALKTEAVAHV